MKNRFRFALVMLLIAASGALSAQNEEKVAYMVADAHLDTQWNWDIQTTIRQYIPKTIRQNLHLLRTYPDYIFNFEGAIKYSWMKEYFPTEYEEVKKYIKEGRWHLTGTSWDADEVVIVSPESWLRNTLMGQTFYRQEYGLESTDVFLPDCFGFGYDLPTLAAHCGLIGFSSQKLGWRNNPFYDGKLKKYPYSIGVWKGIDGNSILMAHGYGYTQSYDDVDISQDERLYRNMSESPIGIGYQYYGTGDTGGSPNIKSVRAIEKGLKGTGPVKIVSATSDQLYKDLIASDRVKELPVWDGELLMDVHGTGCYTSQAAMKLYNRQNEHLADAAERAAVVAEWLGASAYPRQTMHEAWSSIILHQFHDDLTGTSIPRAYEFSWNDELIASKRLANVLTDAVNGVSSRLNTAVNGIPVVLYNTESNEQRAVAEITLPDMQASYSVKGPDGKTLPSQVVQDAQGNRILLVDATVPATGWSVLSLKAAGKKTTAEKEVKKVENSVYAVTFDEKGDICSLVDKRVGKELVEEGKTFGLVVFDDARSVSWPAWEILKRTLDKEPLPVASEASVTLIEQGPIRTTVKISRTLGESVINQYVRLYEGSLAERIDIYNEVEWNSENALLKANFPMNIANEEATYDLGLGSVPRANNRDNQYEVYSHEWTDLTDADGSYGITILNDCKYGWDKPNDNTLRLSLLYTPSTGRGYSYQSKQDLGHHAFTYSIVGHPGKLDKGAAVWQSTQLNSPVRAFVAPRHKGELGKSFSFVSSDNKNVTVRALKKAEVSDEYVVRVYENSGAGEQHARITFAAVLANAVEADGTEKTKGAAKVSGNVLEVDIAPFSVKTFKVTFADAKKVSEPVQEKLELAYDKRCVSSNEFRSGADFEGGNSFASELLPADGQLVVDGVHYVLGDYDGYNGMVCRGQEVKLPEGIYNKVYLLAASTRGDQKLDITCGKNKATVEVPSYTGFLGQWGHTGHTHGFCKKADVVYVGTHRHTSTEDQPYEFTYLFRVAVDVPKGATSIVLQENANVVVFAATAVNEAERVTPACSLFKTGNKTDAVSYEAAMPARVNILKDAKIIGVSGEVNRREVGANINDGDMETKWCDTRKTPHWIMFDFGKPVEVSGWRLVSAGQEDASYITRACLLMGREKETDEWTVLDMLDGNKSDDVERSFDAAKVRFLRLMVTGPEQDLGDGATRIYEMEVYE
ncbi:MAG: discoidin domain-containing protein [Bacteroidaceae bacterium]|nr:discoidin domain-containing protein [Bacteroidaceae bacterium]